MSILPYLVWVVILKHNLFCSLRNLTFNIKIMEEDKKEIKDAEISEVENQLDEKENKKNYNTEMILILVIGLLLGIMLKAEALKNLSIGFNDYKIKGGQQAYDTVAIEKKMKEDAQMKKAEAEAAAQEAKEKNNSPETESVEDVQ